MGSLCSSRYFYDASKHACESTIHAENKITLAIIIEHLKKSPGGDLMYELASMKFQDPWTSSRAEIEGKYDELRLKLSESFRVLRDDY